MKKHILFLIPLLGISALACQKGNNQGTGSEGDTSAETSTESDSESGTGIDLVDTSTSDNGTDTNTESDSDTYSDADTNTDTTTDFDSDTYSDTEPDTDTYTDEDSDTGSVGEVWVYPGPEEYESAVYEVTVIHGINRYTSFVYADRNKHTAAINSMTDYNHWSTFSFRGSVEVEVRKKTGNLGACQIHPMPRSIACSVSEDKATFSLNGSEKLWLEFDGEYENPLFIFADPPEVNPPSPTDPNVVYWGPGVYDIGKHYPLEPNKTYYLAGGAYLRGSLLSTSNADNIVVRGRGVLSGENIPPCGYNECGFDRVAVRFDGSQSDNLHLEGITIINPGQYCIQAYGGQLTTDNIKAMGWHHETDGWVAGNGTSLTNSFFKVYDDVVKLYFDGQVVQNLVVYKQHNGAVFQLGWGGEDGANSNVDDIYVVADETNWNQTGLEGNRAFLNCANGNSGNTANSIDLNRIWYDSDISYVIGIKTEGTYNGIAIRNMTIAGSQKWKSYLAGGTILGVKFDNVSLNGNCVEDNFDINLQIAGDVSPVSYQCD